MSDTSILFMIFFALVFGIGVIQKTLIEIRDRLDKVAGSDADRLEKLCLLRMIAESASPERYEKLREAFLAQTKQGWWRNGSWVGG